MVILFTTYYNNHKESSVYMCTGATTGGRGLTGLKPPPWTRKKINVNIKIKKLTNENEKVFGKF